MPTESYGNFGLAPRGSGCPDREPPTQPGRRRARQLRYAARLPRRLRSSLFQLHGEGDSAGARLRVDRDGGEVQHPQDGGGIVAAGHPIEEDDRLDQVGDVAGEGDPDCPGDRGSTLVHR